MARRVQVICKCWYGGGELCGVMSLLAPPQTAEGYRGRAILHLLADVKDEVHAELLADLERGGGGVFRVEHCEGAPAFEFFAYPKSSRFKFKAGHLVQLFIVLECEPLSVMLADDDPKQDRTLTPFTS